MPGRGAEREDISTALESAMLWGAGGDILTADHTKAAFDSPQGLEALTMLKSMAVDDKSVYINNGAGTSLLVSATYTLLPYSHATMRLAR